MSRPKTFWRRRTGITLIEVLAALTLLGSLAVAMVLSRGRLVEQHQRAEQKREAVDAAQALLAGWWSTENKDIPAGISGNVEGHPNWVWHTKEITSRELVRFDARLIRLRIVDESTTDQPVELTAIDLVMPMMQASDASRSSGGGS